MTALAIAVSEWDGPQGQIRSC